MLPPNPQNKLHVAYAAAQGLGTNKPELCPLCTQESFAMFAQLQHKLKSMNILHAYAQAF